MIMANKHVTVPDILYEGSFCLSRKAKDKYCKYFKATKKKNEHFLTEDLMWKVHYRAVNKGHVLFVKTGAEVAVLVKDKGLSKKDLFHVWKFADADEEGHLSMDKFCLAMAMIDTLKKRRAMPDFTILKKTGLRVTIKKGNIEEEESDMIVCAFRSAKTMKFSRGLSSSSIFLAGGIALQDALDREIQHLDGKVDGRIVVIPGKGDLKCSHVSIGIIPHNKESTNLKALTAVINGCLQAAVIHRAKSLSIPLLGTGRLGHERADIAAILFEVLENFSTRSTLEDVFLVAHPYDKASLCELKAAEQRHLDRVNDNGRSGEPETARLTRLHLNVTSYAKNVSLLKRLEYEKIFTEYADKKHGYSISGKRLPSILLQTGASFYAVQQVMNFLSISDQDHVGFEDFRKASALIDRMREGYILTSLHNRFAPTNLMLEGLFNNIKYQQHIFDPRYCISWFYPRDMRFETAEQILKKPGHQEGSFLVWRRKAEDFYNLGTIYGGKTFHLRIDITGTFYSIEKSVKFPLLGSLIKHYMTHPLPQLGDRRLKYPIPVNVPSTERWFYPNISPAASILLLSIFGAQEDSCIVRYSVETPGCCALIIKKNNWIVAFKIIHKHGFYCLKGGEDSSERFRNLDKLMEYYDQNPISTSRGAVHCKPYTIRHEFIADKLPKCTQHPWAPLLVGNNQDELLCLICSEKVERHIIAKMKLEGYRKIFSCLDSENFSVGLLTESSVKSLLYDKGVPEDAVSKIWELADVDGDSFLDEDEFCLAMYLADLALSYKMLPQGLPPTLMPPYGVEEEKNLPEEILQMDQRSIRLYRECLEDQEEADYHIRVVVIGQTGVGKTTLTHNLLKPSGMRPSEKTMSTDGVEIHNSFVSLSDNSWITDDSEMKKANKSHDAKLIKLFRSSTSPESEPSSTSLEVDEDVEDDLTGDDQTYVSPESASKSDDISFTLDDSDTVDAPTGTVTGVRSPSHIVTDSLSACKEFLQTVHSFEKAKLRPSTPAMDQGQAKGDPFFNTVRNLVMSHKDSVADLEDSNYGELSVWDFAGQFVFYTTHHTFLTPRAVYLLVTRLDQNINDPVDNDQCALDITGCRVLKIRDLISYWMNSIHTYSQSAEHLPPVILVGTHLDKVEGDVEKKTKSYFEELRKYLLEKPTSRHLIDQDFTVSKTPNELDIECLQQKIVELASKQKYWGEKIPARWIALEKVMMEQKLKGVSVLSYEEVVELDKKTGVPIHDQEKLDLFLRFQHAIGNIIYFSEGCLRNHIVLNPQWLIDAFKCIITARQFCIENPALVQHWDALNSTGRLHQSMVEEIFRKDARFCPLKEHVLGLMERLDILSRPSVYEDAEKNHPTLQEFYFVPSLLQDKLTDCLLNRYICRTNRTPFLCFVFKNNFLPPAVFHRLLAACLSKYPVAKQGNQLLMFCGCGIFDLNHGLTRLVVAFYDNIIQIGLFRYSEKNLAPEASLCESVQKFVTETLKRVLGRYCMNLPFTLSLKCEQSQLLSNEGLLSVEDLTSGGDKIVCHGHDTKSHIIDRQRHLQSWFPDKIPSTDTNLDGICDQFTSVSFGHLDTIPEDAELNRISAKIGKEFETLAGFLGLDNAEIFQIRSNHQFDTRSQIYHILVRWKQKSGKNATYQCLEEAFKNSDINVDILSGP